MERMDLMTFCTNSTSDSNSLFWYWNWDKVKTEWERIKTHLSWANHCLINVSLNILQEQTGTFHTSTWTCMYMIAWARFKSYTEVLRNIKWKMLCTCYLKYTNLFGTAVQLSTHQMTIWIIQTEPKIICIFISLVSVIWMSDYQYNSVTLSVQQYLYCQYNSVYTVITTVLHCQYNSVIQSVYIKGVLGSHAL